MYITPFLTPLESSDMLSVYCLRLLSLLISPQTCGDIDGEMV